MSSNQYRQTIFNRVRADFGNGRISRRTFMSQAAALGMLGAASISVKSVEAATPKKGGRMRIGSLHGQATDVLDPALLFNGTQWMIAYGVRDTLTQIGAGSSLDPCLATEWMPNENGSRWTFTLRQGVEFHNGKTLTQDDVIASINHHRGKDSESAVKPIADQISDVRKDGSDKIVFDLAQPNVDFPYSLASANFTICQQSDDGIDANSGIGTAGYVLKEFDPGVRTVVERNPNYWRDDRAFADSIELITISDSTARVSALTSGSVDVIDDIDFKVIALLGKKPGVVVEETSGPLHYLFSMMSDRAPFEDVNVRLAMKYACDREALIDKVLLGHGSLGNDHPIGPSYSYHDADLEQRAYDPDKAKYHLKQAGLDSLDLDVSASSAAYGGAVDATLLLQESAKAAGININVVREAVDGFWNEVYMNKPIFTNYWGGYTRASEMLSTGYLPDAAWNESQFKSEQFVKILNEANAELDQAKRREMMSTLQRIVHDEAGQLIYAFPNNVLARNEKLGHGELANDRPMDGRQIFERWWVS